jgi:soluble lytic murein transglycosylase-like protein
MNPPKKHRGFLLFFAGLSGISLACAIMLSARQAESRRTIASLRKTVASLEYKIGVHQDAMAKTDFYRFQENIYRLQSPEFAAITASVFSQSRKFAVNPYLVMAVIFVESRFNRHAVSKAGACGLMQVNYPVWKDELKIERSRLSEIDYNIELGLTILKTYLQETGGDMVKALILYNSGYRSAASDYYEKVIASNFYRHAGIG